MSERSTRDGQIGSDMASPNADGGARRDRTADLLRARQALSQLSYGPVRRTVVHGSAGRSGDGGSGWI